MKRKVIKAITIPIGVILLIVAGYFAYVFLTYYRLEDNLTYDIEGKFTEEQFETGKEYIISSANLGFGAYSDDYSFFMDGGTESWAFSKEAVKDNMNGILEQIKNLNADISLFQEIDKDATRSYHVDEEKIICKQFEQQQQEVNYNWVQIYDSAFLFYPITQPHGKSLSGIMTVSPYAMTRCIRRSLPIDEGLSKVMELDRCYSKNYFHVANGKELVVFNVHLSAYAKDESVATKQVQMLNKDMVTEVEQGNYVIAGGDMNKDLLGDSSKYFDAGELDENWAKPFPTDLLSEEIQLVAPLDEADPVPSCRNADVAYSKDTFVVTVDGFLVSSNVDVVEALVQNNEFKYSDHNPVYMRFILE